MSGSLDRFVKQYTAFIKLALTHKNKNASRFCIVNGLINIINDYISPDHNIKREESHFIEKLLSKILFEFNKFIIDQDDFELFKHEINKFGIWLNYPFDSKLSPFEYPTFSEINKQESKEKYISFLLYKTFFNVGIYLLKTMGHTNFIKYVDGIFWPNFDGNENIKMPPFWLINLYLYTYTDLEIFNSEINKEELQKIKTCYFLLYLSKLLITNYKDVNLIFRQEDRNTNYNKVLLEFCKEKNIESLKDQLDEFIKTEQWNNTKLFFHPPWGDFEEKGEKEEPGTYELKDAEGMNAKKAFKITKEWIQNLSQNCVFLKGGEPLTSKQFEKGKLEEDQKEESRRAKRELPEEETNPKFIEVKEKIWESYLKNSFIPNLFRAKEYDESIDSPENFIQIAYRPLIDHEWVDMDNYMGDPIWEDIGRIIAFGELNHIVKLIHKKKGINSITWKNLKNKEICDEINGIVNETFDPDLILIPNKVLLELETPENYKSGRLFKENNFLVLKYRDIKLKIIPERGKIKFNNNIIVLNSNSISWTYKPYNEINDKKRRLWINIERYNASEIDITTKTVIKAELRYPEKVKIIHIEELP